MKSTDETQAVLDRCHMDYGETLEFPYTVYYYYFTPKALLTKDELEKWYDEEDNCLTTNMMMRQPEAIDHVYHWAKERSIPITKTAILKAFQHN